MNERAIRWALLGVLPPRPEAKRVERLRFVRDLQLRWLPIDLIGLVVVMLVGIALPFVILIAFTTVVLVLDAAWLSIRIAREPES